MRLFFTLMDSIINSKRFEKLLFCGQWIIYLLRTQDFPRSYLLPSDTHTYIDIMGYAICPKLFAYVLNEWSVSYLANSRVILGHSRKDYRIHSVFITTLSSCRWPFLDVKYQSLGKRKLDFQLGTVRFESKITYCQFLLNVFILLLLILWTLLCT